MKLDGVVYAVKLTVKEYVSKEQGRKLYNQELQSIEMPDVIWVQDSKKSSPNPPPSGTTVSLARIMARFNGAATWKSRKAIEEKTTFVICVTASMGPRLGSRGKTFATDAPKITIPLQWGRDLEVAERFTGR